LAELQNVLTLGEKTENVWIESLSVQRTTQFIQVPIEPAKDAPKDAKVETKSVEVPVVRVTITVCALMDKIAPGAAFNANQVNEKFQFVRDALQGSSSFVQKVDQRTADGDAKPNLPKRTFVLTINPNHIL
jgi:hypothetical protein